MEVVNPRTQQFLDKLKSLLWSESEVSTKKQINWRSLKLMAIASAVAFVALVLLLPTEQDRSFAQKSESTNAAETTASAPAPNRQSAERLWESPKHVVGTNEGSSQNNYDTPMILDSELGNARTQLRSGERISIRFLDRFVVSDMSVPVLAEVTSDASTQSGLKIPAGSKLYGEAVFQKGQTRTDVSFNRISFPNGQIRAVSMKAVGHDGQLGLEGHVKSDADKNTVGSVLTTFIAGLASGSVETDPFGGSRGGIENGVLTAVASAAKDRANAYGEKLKTEREWMEVDQGFECEAVLREVFDFQKTGARQ